MRSDQLQEGLEVLRKTRNEIAGFPQWPACNYFFRVRPTPDRRANVPKITFLQLAPIQAATGSGR
jgi:hypothetical protein